MAVSDPLRRMHRTEVPGVYRRGGRFVVVFYSEGRQRKRSFRRMADAIGFKEHERIEVELPVCPVCRRAGKIPGSLLNGAFWCEGSRDHPHQRTRMGMQVFVQVHPSKGVDEA